MLPTLYIYFDGCVIEFISNKYKYWYDELHESEIKIQMDIDLNSKIIKIYSYHNNENKYNRLGNTKYKFVVNKPLNVMVKFYSNIKSLYHYNKENIDKRLYYKTYFEPTYENEPKLIQEFYKKYVIKKSYYKQNSKKIGEYREYEKLTNTSDSNNTNTNTYLKILCNYVDNMLHGKYIIYDNMQNILEEYNYINNMRQGEYKIYNKSILIIEEIGNYLNNMKINYIKYYCANSNNIIKKTIFTEIDRINNIYKQEVYYPNQKLKKIAYMKFVYNKYIWVNKSILNNDPLLNGEYIEYYECNYFDSNIIKLKCFYKDNILDGEYIEYYVSGKIKKKCFYKDNILDGEYIENYECGNIKIKCFYKENVISGEYIENYECGNIKIKCFYKDNVISGEYIEKYKDGNLKIYYTINDGKKIGYEIILHKYDNDTISSENKKKIINLII